MNIILILLVIVAIAETILHLTKRCENCKYWVEHGSYTMGCCSEICKDVHVRLGVQQDIAAKPNYLFTNANFYCKRFKMRVVIEVRNPEVV